MGRTACALHRTGNPVSVHTETGKRVEGGRRVTDAVDVLIVGAGASGAAVAWSLAETRMRIVCLEQGDWMNPAEYPSAGRDWEARAFSDMSISPNRRKRETDYPVNDENSPISVANFNAVGGSTILYAGHFPRFHPSDFRVKSLDGVADDCPSTTKGWSRSTPRTTA